MSLLLTEQNETLSTEATPLLLTPCSETSEAYSVEEYTSKTTMFWEEFFTIPNYALPILWTNLLEYSLVFVPVISIGHLSTEALAAISLGSMTASVTGLSIVHGVAATLDTLLPSAWTSPHPHLMGLWAQRLTVVMICFLIPILMLWMNAEPILLLLRQQPNIAHLAAVYLRYFSIGLPAFAFNEISRRFFQSQGLFSIPTRIILMVCPVNVVLNYALVWGPPSIRLGFIGAPIASAISFCLMGLSSLLYGLYFMPKDAWHPLTWKMFTNLGIVVRLSIAGIFQSASEWWAWELIALAASLLGPTVLASQSVTLVSTSMTFQIPFSLAVATSVRIGHLLGEGRAKRASVAAFTSVTIAFALSITTSIMYMSLRKYWASLFNNDKEVIDLVASVLPIVALYQVFEGNSAVCGGILRAVGKQSISAALNFSGYYMLGLPLGIWLAFRRELGLHGLWIGLTVALVYGSLIGSAMWLRINWQDEVSKVLSRLNEGNKPTNGRHAEESA